MREEGYIQRCLRTFGIIVGIDGVLHGSAEMLQGFELVETHVFASCPENWPNSYFYEQMDGMPAFSILTGIPFVYLGGLAVVLSVLLLLHTVFRLDSRWGLPVFALLILLGALFGAGFGTPITLGLPLVGFGFLANVFEKRTRSEPVAKALRGIFRVSFALQLSSWPLFWGVLVGLSFFGIVPDFLYAIDVLLMLATTPFYLMTGLMLDNTTPTDVNGRRGSI